MTDIEARWEYSVRCLDSIAALDDDWDGQGAAAPRPQTVRLARSFSAALRAARCAPPTTVTPTPAGTVLFGWQGDRGYLETEAGPGDLLEWMAVGPDGRAAHGGMIPADVTELKTRIESLDDAMPAQDEDRRRVAANGLRAAFKFAHDSRRDAGRE